MAEEGGDTVKRRNGKFYRKFKGQMGRVYWIEMSEEEVLEADLFRLIVAVTPLITILLFAWAAGVLK